MCELMYATNEKQNLLPNDLVQLITYQIIKTLVNNGQINNKLSLILLKLLNLYFYSYNSVSNKSN